jgi:hypothetical protein
MARFLFSPGMLIRELEKSVLLNFSVRFKQRFIVCLKQMKFLIKTKRIAFFKIIEYEQE